MPQTDKSYLQAPSAAELDAMPPVRGPLAYGGDPTTEQVVGRIQAESQRAIPVRDLQGLYGALVAGRVVDIGNLNVLGHVLGRLEPNPGGFTLTPITGPEGSIYVGEIVAAHPDCQGGGGTVAVILAQGPNGPIAVPASLAGQYVYAPNTQLHSQEGFNLGLLLAAGAFRPFEDGSPLDSRLNALTGPSPQQERAAQVSAPAYSPLDHQQSIPVRGM
jgi:hypothetical protein